MGQMVYIVAMIAIFYFLLIRPQQKKSKALTQLRNSIVAGDKVVTIGGLTGKVISVLDDEIRLDVEGTQLTFKTWAVSTKVVEAGKDELDV